MSPWCKERPRHARAAEGWIAETEGVFWASRAETGVPEDAFLVSRYTTAWRRLGEREKAAVMVSRAGHQMVAMDITSGKVDMRR